VKEVTEMPGPGDPNEDLRKWRDEQRREEAERREREAAKKNEGK
jgi:hypothetical protein